MQTLYNISIRLYWFFVLVAYPFHPKAKKWIFGRIHWRKKIKPKSKAQLVWLHCASLGEFEMARPIIEKMEWSNRELYVSFFSPSGYEVRKDYQLASHVFYLPVDTPENAPELLDIVNPDLLLFVKYDLWLNLIKEAKKRKVPVVLFSAIFRKDQIYFKAWGDIFKKMLLSLDYIFVQNQQSVDLLKQVGVISTLSGDVRFDRALEVKEQPFKDEFIESFVEGAQPAIIFGSTYPIEHHWIHQLMDELTSLGKSFKFIVAPHQIDAGSMHDVKEVFPNAYYYSKHKSGAKFESNLLILDTMGMLTYVYRYASVAYIGGGFGKSLHNALEAAVYGIPILVGPNHLKFPEVEEFIQHGGFIQVNSKADFRVTIFELIEKNLNLNELGKDNFDLVKSRSGASEKIRLVFKKILANL